MSKSVYYFRRYRQSQDGATIPEEQNRTERSTVVLDDRMLHCVILFYTLLHSVTPFYTNITYSANITYIAYTVYNVYYIAYIFYDLYSVDTVLALFTYLDFVMFTIYTVYFVYCFLFTVSHCLLAKSAFLVTYKRIVQYSTLQYSTVKYSTVQYSIVCTVQYIMYSIV